MHAQTLRPILVLNAVFSVANGVLLVLASPMAATWIGPPVDWIYALLGVGLLLFGLVLSGVAIRPTPLAVLAITGADLAWVIATTTALLVWRHDVTPLGWALVLGTNAVVASLAWFQQRAIRQCFRAAGRTDEYDVCIEVNAPVSADAFWKVLADLGAIQRYMPALRSSSLTVGEQPGVGCVRTCENTAGQVWSERCEAWEEGTSFSVTFLTESPSFPFPFSTMHGGWRVTPSVTGCQVRVWWRVMPRRTWAAAVLLPIMTTNARRSIPGAIARMARAAQGLPSHSKRPLAVPRLHAVLC